MQINNKSKEKKQKTIIQIIKGKNLTRIIDLEAISSLGEKIIVMLIKMQVVIILMVILMSALIRKKQLVNSFYFVNSNINLLTARSKIMFGFLQQKDSNHDCDML